MGTPFSDTLTRLRTEAGFKTAYAFFHKNGGRELFRVSFRHYLLFEHGRRLPAFENIGYYIFALRLTHMSAPAVELTTAWLRTSLGEPAFAHFLKPLFLCQPQPVPGALHKALQTSLTGDKYHLTPRQMQAISTDSGTYLCWMLLSNDTAGQSPAELAKSAGLAPADLQKALAALAKAGVLRRKGGIYRCPMAGKMIEYPHGNTSPVAYKKLSELRSGLMASGQQIYIRRGMLRASLQQLANVIPLLGLNVSTAQVYSIYEKRKDSALFGVECRVVKIRDF
ncbi:MAG: hypothetical protein HY952_07145 [Elusimicrobia bacterium]|nr:hypothetical protein [Elusimicrobiota bacterium]